MAEDTKVWHGNWRDSLALRLTAHGCASMTEFVTRFPGEPYMALAQRLGQDVAALQVEWMHLAEAKEQGSVRAAAADSLCRDLNYYLPNGWRSGAKGDFDTSRAFAVWATRLEQTIPEVAGKPDAVWQALERIRPPWGWSPRTVEDEVLEQAFRMGWS